MAIDPNDIYEIPSPGDINEQGYTSFQRQFIVKTGDPSDRAKAVAYAVGLKYGLGWGSQYNCGGSEIDLNARCKRQRAEPIQGELNLWRFTAEYDSSPWDFGAGSTDLTASGTPPDRSTTDPTLLPLMVKSVTVEQDIALTTDYSTPSKKVRASNGQSFSPAVMVKRYIPGVQITTYTNWAPWYNKVRFTGAVNNDTYLGFAPNTLLCSAYEVESQFQQNQYFYKVDITFLIADPESGDPDWDLRILDAGCYEYISTMKPCERIKDSQGNFVTEPVPLDGNGRKLPLGDALVYLLFRGHKFRAFSGLLAP